MKAPKFSYVRATASSTPCQLLAEHGDDARILAGGQSLMPTLNMRLSRPKLLIDINRLESLAGATFDGKDVRIGALTRHADVMLSHMVAKYLPLIAAGDAARRPRRRAQSRHVRRQRRARRSGRRDAGLPAGARRHASCCRACAAGARSRPRTISTASTRPRAQPDELLIEALIPPRARRRALRVPWSSRGGTAISPWPASPRARSSTAARSSRCAPRLLRQRGQADARQVGDGGRRRQAVERRHRATRVLAALGERPRPHGQPARASPPPSCIGSAF